MPMSEEEIALWTQQGSRRVRATLDSAGRAETQSTTSYLVLWVIGALIMWILTLLWLF